MRRLQRPPSPACLGRYRHGRDPWDRDHPSQRDRATLQEELRRMQRRWCAYCEGDLDELGQHIEHFATRSRHPQRTYDWSNLFLSCEQADSCGHRKDDRRTGGYALADLLDPCVDDPDHYLRFRSDGSVVPRPGLSDPDRRRAQETLRVLGLDNPRLQSMRRLVLSGYTDPRSIDGLDTLSPEELDELLGGELLASQAGAFQTAARHMLCMM